MGFLFRQSSIQWRSSFIKAPSTTLAMTIKFYRQNKQTFSRVLISKVGNSDLSKSAYRRQVLRNVLLNSRSLNFR